MRAVTDAGPTEANQPKPQPIENIFQLLEAFSSTETYNHFNDLYNKCEIRYGDLKKQLAEDIISYTTPFREKIEALSKDDAYLRKVAVMGAEKARASASKTIREVREIIGFRQF